MKHLFLIFIVLFFLFGCKKESTNSFFVDDSNSKDKFELSEFFNIKKVIKLETNESSVMGYIRSLKFAQNGISFCLPEQNKILTFNSNGDFKKSWLKTGEGPGETPKNSLFTFCFTPQGYLFVSGGTKWQLFDEKGEIIKEVIKPYSGSYVADCMHCNNSIFAVLKEIKDKPVILEISIPDLRVVKKYGKASNPLKWFNGGSDLISSYQNYIVFTSQNALQLNFLNTKTGDTEIWLPEFKEDKINKLIFPNIGEAGRLRWIKTGGFDNFLYLNYCRYTGTTLGKQDFFSSHHLILNLQTKKCCEIYSVGKAEIKDLKYWWYIGGICGDYLVAVCPDFEEFNKNKGKYPELSNIEFNIDDNPIILLLEPKKEILP